MCEDCRKIRAEPIYNFPSHQQLPHIKVQVQKCTDMNGNILEDLKLGTAGASTTNITFSMCVLLCYSARTFPSHFLSPFLC